MASLMKLRFPFAFLSSQRAAIPVGIALVFASACGETPIDADGGADLPTARDLVATPDLTGRRDLSSLHDLASHDFAALRDLAFAPSDLAGLCPNLKGTPTDLACTGLYSDLARRSPAAAPPIPSSCMAPTTGTL